MGSEAPPKVGYSWRGAARGGQCRRGLRRESKFVFTNKDGAEVPALPEPQKVGGGATLAAASAEDLVILNLAL